MRTARLIAAVALTAAAVPVGLTASAPCAGAEHGPSVAVAVDFGELDASPPSIACVPVTDGMTGAEVLEVRAEQLGTEPPRYDSAGLLCAIDGLPAEGCGEPTADGGYRYWAYSVGTSAGWAHADQGPAFRDADPATVEGWRFVDGAGDSTDPPPRAPADAEAACAAATDAARPGGDEGEAPRAPAGDGRDRFPVGAVAGVAVVLALGAAAVAISRRRRP